MENTITKEINNFIKDKNISFTDFCKLCKISPATIKKLMKGNLKVRLSIIVKLSTVLKLKTQYLFQEYL